MMPILIIIGTLLLPFMVGIGVLLLSKLLFSAQSHPALPPALLFHSLSSEPRKNYSHLPVNIYDQLLIYINKNNIPTYTASEIIAYQTQETQKRNSVTPISLHFDDAFEDFYSLAFPLMQKYKLSCTLYPVTAFIGKKATWNVYKAAQHCSLEQLKEMHKAGIEIGSHTRTHADLSLLPDNLVRQELEESKKYLEDALGINITALSFPFGSWNHRCWAIAQECGYESATIYRKHSRASSSMIPVKGVYAFDTAEDIIEKITEPQRIAHSFYRAQIMPHFAKGSAFWKYRKEYNPLLLFKGEAK